MTIHFTPTVTSTAAMAPAATAGSATAAIARPPAAAPTASIAMSTSAPSAIVTLVGSRMRTTSVAVRASTRRRGGLVVRAGSVSSGTRGSSSAGAPNHEVPSGA
jgi:hypothetical protein